MAEPPRPPVRVAFVGNVANAMFRMASALRDHPGIEPHLFVGRHDPATARPESADPTLAGAYPDWIHEGTWITAASVLAPWRAPLTRALSQFDLVVATGPAPIFAQFAGPPWCWYVTGGDLTVKPFPVEFRSWYSTWRHRAGELVGGTWQRRAARRADVLWVQPFAPMLDAARRLGVHHDRLSTRYLPLPVDVDSFDPARVPPATDAVAQRMQAADLAVLHPSRLVMDQDPKLVRTGQWKGNDRLIRAFALLVERGEVPDPLLVMPDSTMSRDVAAAKALVRELGITDQVLWARPPRPGGFTQAELRDLYAASDVVCDEFGIGWFGYVTLEGLAMGRPVVSHVDEAVMSQLYPDGHPIIDASTPDQIADRLSDLWRDPASAAAVGQESRRWVEARHGPDAVREIYASAVGEVIDELLGGPEPRSRRPRA